MLPFRFRSVKKVIGVTILAIAGVCVATSPAFAQHRARLSRGLMSQVRDGRPDMRVLYEGPKAEADRLAKEYGLKVARHFNGLAVLTGTSAQFDAVASDPNVHSMTDDGRVQGTMATTTVSTGASQLWGRGPRNYGGLTGAGITVAVIDSGVDRHHPDVAPSLMLEKDFTGTGEGDEYGHGTHVAGIIAGRGSRVGTESTYVGMAPGAAIVSLKVLTADGTGLRVERARVVRVDPGEQGPIQHPRGQRLGGAASGRPVERRSAGQGDGAPGGVPESLWWRRRVTSGNWTTGRRWWAAWCRRVTRRRR